MKIRKTLSSAALAVGVVLALPGTANATITSSVYETGVSAYTNLHRVAHGLVTLRGQSCVDGYAERHAQWMASRKTLKHQSMTTVLNGCNLSRVGENIAYGFPSGSTVVSAWMHSSGHRANILKSSYRMIGVGAAQDSSGRWWVSQVFGTY